MSKLAGTKGGSGVWQRIISEMPEHEVYIEPFWGRGTIARKKRPARITIGCDKDLDAFPSGRAVGALMFQTCGVQWLRDYFRLPRGEGSVGESSSKYSAAGNCDTSRNCPVRPGRDAETGAEDLPAAVAATFGGASWQDHCVYIDPPYLGCSGYYKFELTEGQHVELCRAFLALPCPAILSGYRTRVHDAELGDARAIDIPTVNRAGRRVIETVWLNFPPPQRYHDTRFIGRNKRERERIRRRQRNWADGLARMGPAERQAIYEACDATFQHATH